MNIAISTGTFYKIPFQRALSLIKRAGFEFIELLPHWKGGRHWEMAQHLKGIPPKDVLKMIDDSGLRISSLHDGGGVIEDGAPSVIARSTYEYLDQGVPIPCVVFHVPHRMTDDADWWAEYEPIAIRDLSALPRALIVCMENLMPFEGYAMPLLAPAEMLRFTAENGFFVNIDTTHYAQSGVDIKEAAKVLKDRVRTVHLSDYKDGKAHIFIGEGDLDLKGFTETLNRPLLHAITLECDIEYHAHDDTKTIDRLRQALDYATALR